eukprot:CAMPEP_0202746102 /NCGR_PEP_ID=MMETSP1388-20130828/7865_1 /ASSEMBLY_ACC=CAM_ASM_000864 /TAXON_ID=37098 /ORGANISM="Isochrysis sp, Strain CCMP1244" /LENGTH=51 /DNA_ID=CAMNT_0049413321 /DNA_START=714 /DNA_END=869 /DNA_ORIENTATION=-
MLAMLPHGDDNGKWFPQQQDMADLLLLAMPKQLDPGLLARYAAFGEHNIAR